MKLWSWRWTVAWGWKWHLERDVTLDTVSEWLQVFQRDEPAVTFAVSVRKPRPLKEAQ